MRGKTNIEGSFAGGPASNFSGARAPEPDTAMNRLPSAAGFVYGPQNPHEVLAPAEALPASYLIEEYNRLRHNRAPTLGAVWTLLECAFNQDVSSNPDDKHLRRGVLLRKAKSKLERIAHRSKVPLTNTLSRIVLSFMPVFEARSEGEIDQLDNRQLDGLYVELVQVMRDSKVPMTRDGRPGEWLMLAAAARAGDPTKLLLPASKREEGSESFPGYNHDLYPLQPVKLPIQIKTGPVTSGYKVKVVRADQIITTALNGYSHVDEGEVSPLQRRYQLQQDYDLLKHILGNETWHGYQHPRTKVIDELTRLTLEATAP